MYGHGRYKRDVKRALLKAFPTIRKGALAPLKTARDNNWRRAGDWLLMCVAVPVLLMRLLWYTGRRIAGK